MERPVWGPRVFLCHAETPNLFLEERAAPLDAAPGPPQGERAASPRSPQGSSSWRASACLGPATREGGGTWRLLPRQRPPAEETKPSSLAVSASAADDRAPISRRGLPGKEVEVVVEMEGEGVDWRRQGHEAPWSATESSSQRWALGQRI